MQEDSRIYKTTPEFWDCYSHSTHNPEVGACASQTTTIPKRLTYVVSTRAAKPAQT